MMLSAEAIADVVEVLETDDFYRSANAKIYATLRDLYARGEPVDIITGIEAPAHAPDSSKRSAASCTCATSSIRCPPRPRPATTRRSSPRPPCGAGSSRPPPTSWTWPSPSTEDAETVADDAEQRIYDVARRDDREDVAVLRDLVSDAMADLESIQNRDSAYTGIPTGFVDLDNLMSGLQPGNLIVVAARPGIGKSSLAMNIARNIAVDRQPVAMFSLEMSRMEIGMRLLCAEARVPWDRIRNKRVGPDDWQRVVHAAEVLHDAPLSIVDSGNVNIVDIRAKARRMRSSSEGLSLIIVDYLQLMTSPSVRRPDNRQQEVAEISRNLKMLAKELHVPVMALSQLNRNPEARADKRPQLSDLRESGAIEQDSDVVMFIHRDDNDPEKKKQAELIVAKHRNGPTDTIRLTFEPSLTQFRNAARDLGA